MDAVGTEVGQKMRSAVKAKLIELGTGYIDDELPDYVMIMVANKRSKQQMTEDLNLFLGSNTDPFVSWLHQVLQKLQEVTLPPTTSSTSSSVAKRKTSASSDANDKKKKDKKLKRSHKTKSIESADTQQKPATPPPPSITDVFADHLIQKAKTGLMLENAVAVKTKSEQLAKDSNEKTSSDDFDIPTITEIAENEVVKVNRRKELNDLAELQKQINKAKRHLRSLNSDESEDEDFVNIEDDDDLDDDDDDVVRKRTQNSISNTTMKVGDKIASNRSQRVQISFNETQSDGSNTVGKTTKKLSVMERLGVKPTLSTNRENVISLSANRRVEQEIYVPAFRRNDDDKRPKISPYDRTALRSRERDAAKESTNRNAAVNSREQIKDLRSRESSRGLVDRERNRELVRDLRERVGRSKITEENTVKLTAKQRIGSRVIVAPPKPEYDDDAVVEVPVNSVIRVKPRPIIPSNKQASKNLLLKAVAEAQKSTAMVKPRPESPTTQSVGSAQKLFTKSFRDQQSRMAKGKKNIVIEVTRQADDDQADEDDEQEFVEEGDDEYVTAMISDAEEFEDDDCYTPAPINTDNSDQEMKEYTYQPATGGDQTKFVVTLNADKYMSSSGTTKTSDRKRTEINGAAQSQPDKLAKRSYGMISQKEKERTSSPRVDITAQKVNKLIIKNDTEDEEELRKEVERSTSRKRSRLSPIKFDLVDEKRSKLQHADQNTDDDHGEDGQRVMIKRSDVSKKYDNVPPLLNSISTDKSKTKERCKFYPSCGKGDLCEFVHPTSPCKAFPNCKFGDKCLYIHPKCKFDLTCTRLECNFSHTAIISAAPPLSSHVVPVMNYKSIGTTVNTTVQCKFFPKCKFPTCQFYHPKPCHYGKNCANRAECNFYHFDTTVPSKLKWVAPSDF